MLLDRLLPLLLDLRKKHILDLLSSGLADRPGMVTGPLWAEGHEVAFSVDGLGLEWLVVGLGEDVGQVVEVLGQDDGLHQLRIPLDGLDEHVVAEFVLDSLHVQDLRAGRSLRWVDL